MTVAIRAEMDGRGAAHSWWGDGAAMAFYTFPGAESEGAADDTFAAEAET